MLEEGGNKSARRPIRRKVRKGNILTSRGNFLSCSCDTNDDALSPALVAGLEGRSHNMDIACAVKGVVTASVRHLNQSCLNVLPLLEILGRIDEIGSTKLLGPFLLRVIDIHHNNLGRFLLDSALDDRETNTTGTKDGDVGALLHTTFAGSDDCCTVASSDTTAEETCAVHGSIGGDGYDGDIGEDGVLAESGAAHEVKEVFALALEARSAIRHDTFSLSRTDFAAEVGLARLAELAFPAFWCAVKGASR